MYTCYCIGNPLVDFITEVDDGVLEKFGLRKGMFHPRKKEEALALLEEVRNPSGRLVPGGAAANTACGVCRMGGSACLCGGVGEDEFGKVFTDSLIEAGVFPALASYQEPTGFVVVLVTPDAERTFVVYGGASLRLEESALDFRALRDANYLYFTGYQFENPGLRRVVSRAAAFCRKTLTRVVMDLADAGIVERHRNALREFVRDYVDVLCANEEEGRVYAGGVSGEKCLAVMARDAEWVVLTLGAQGSLIRHMDRVAATPAVKVEAVDTTGAGDIHTAAVLVGMDRGYSLEYIGKMGAYAASLVITRKGARLDRDIMKEIENL